MIIYEKVLWSQFSDELNMTNTGTLTWEIEWRKLGFKWLFMYYDGLPIWSLHIGPILVNRAITHRWSDE